MINIKIKNDTLFTIEKGIESVDYPRNFYAQKVDGTSFELIHFESKRRLLVSIWYLKDILIGGDSYTDIAEAVSLLNSIVYNSSGSLGTIPNLQSVTDEGNQTTNNMAVVSPDGIPKAMVVYDATTGSQAGLISDGRMALGIGPNLAYVAANNLTDERNFELPDEEGTLALEENTIPLNGTKVDKPVTGPIQFLFGLAKTFFCEKLDGLNGPKKTEVLIDQNNFKVKNDITQIDTNRRVINEFDMQKNGMYFDSHYRSPIGDNTKKALPPKSNFKYWGIPESDQTLLDFIQKGMLSDSQSLYGAEIRTRGIYEGNVPIFRILLQGKTNVDGVIEFDVSSLNIAKILPNTSGLIDMGQMEIVIPCYFEKDVYIYTASIFYVPGSNKLVVQLGSNDISQYPIAKIGTQVQLEYTKNN